MTYYEFLIGEKATGNFRKWLQIGAPSQLPKWMEIYDFYLDHLTFSQEQLANHLGTSSSTVQRALDFLNRTFI